MQKIEINNLVFFKLKLLIRLEEKSSEFESTLSIETFHTQSVNYGPQCMSLVTAMIMTMEMMI